MQFYSVLDARTGTTPVRALGCARARPSVYLQDLELALEEVHKELLAVRAFCEDTEVQQMDGSKNGKIYSLY